VHLTTTKSYEYVVKVHKFSPNRFSIEWKDGCESLSLNQDDGDSKWFEPADIVRMRKSGKKLTEITAETGLSTSAIYRAFQRAGAAAGTIRPKVRSLRWAGHRRKRG
jgi:DNA invertase Pin-like site-specific DNA recombinase